MAKAKRNKDSGRKVHVAIVDDHTLMRKGLRAEVEALAGYHAVLIANNGKEFIEQLPSVKRLDMVILDLSMPIMDGFETMNWLVQYRPDVQVLAYSFSTDPVWVARALRAGACGYVVKDALSEELHVALESIRLTGHHHSELALTSLSATDAQAQGERELLPGSERLRAALREYIRLACDPKDFTYDQIAVRMRKTRHAVDWYFRLLHELHGLHSRAALVRFASDNGLLAG